MQYSYNNLWKMLIDKNMSKTELRIKAGISTNMLAKMGKGEAVSMDVLAKVCMAMDCKVNDIVDFSVA